MSVHIHNNVSTASLGLSDFRLMQLSRPSHSVRFVRHGDSVQLFVFMNNFSEVPFLRIPVDSLYLAALKYDRQMEL